MKFRKIFEMSDKGITKNKIKLTLHSDTLLFHRGHLLDKKLIKVEFFDTGMNIKIIKQFENKRMFNDLIDSIFRTLKNNFWHVEWKLKKQDEDEIYIIYDEE